MAPSKTKTEAPAFRKLAAEEVPSRKGGAGARPLNAQLTAALEESFESGDWFAVPRSFFSFPDTKRIRNEIRRYGLALGVTVSLRETDERPDEVALCAVEQRKYERADYAEKDDESGE